ncbi:MAG: hypothetical protein Q7T82_08060 [Armatimonadota bacterium]|nr:hypothetical protein [Armatimonadota bacterium]
MIDIDNYEEYYAEKLWNLLPEIYRTEDTPDFDKKGPLREMVDRIGRQAAIVRRSIDRLWEDQSIETCDDWIIPYIGDLLATNLVAALDARGQRLDVAKTIYYRRRKGTVALLEELATNTTGWSARVVEFFRRMSRTRHSLDPEIGQPSATANPEGYRMLQTAQGLVVGSTRTCIGGYADLRAAYAGRKAHSAFDEFSYSADFRRGRGQVGWHNIPRLGVFLWRLRSFPIVHAKPVGDEDHPDEYTFDPTGRDIPLFAAGMRPVGDEWVSPAEWQLPAAISCPLLNVELENLYAALDSQNSGILLNQSLGLFEGDGNDLIPADQVTVDPSDSAKRALIDPERGRFTLQEGDDGSDIHVSYHYGFASDIGAGPYNRRISDGTLLEQPEPVEASGGDLDTALAKLAANWVGAVDIQDSLTYEPNSGATVGHQDQVTRIAIRANNHERPLIRLKENSTWTFTGKAGSELELDGLFVSGGDVVVDGVFDAVTLRCCTLDPGNADPLSGGYAKAADGRNLVPCRLRIIGQVRSLTIDRCILGPITDDSGEIEELKITDSIVQSIGGEKAIDLAHGEAVLSRCTVLGPSRAHRLRASECILNGFTTVEDRQDGCARFTAWVTGSALPRQYESVELAAEEPLFTSREFGRPGYAQLLETVDASIAEGARDGAEMGAFAREKNAVKERSLLIKYQEFMPLGLIPVIVYVT